MSTIARVQRAVRRYGWLGAVRRAGRRGVRYVRSRISPADERPADHQPADGAQADNRIREIIATGGIDPESVLVVSDPRVGPQIVRKGTTDWPTYHQVFVHDDYAFDEIPAPKRIVDLGANVGYAAVWYHARYPEAQIVAVEPDGGNTQAARVNVTLAGIDGQVDVVQSAIWHSESNLKITNPTANAWAFRVNEAKPGEPGSFPAITMHQLMDRFGFDTVDLVKVDIEAGERFLFAQHTEWLDRVDALVIELHDRHTPGCREPVVAAIDRHFGEYDEVTRGENTLFTRRRPLAAVG